MYFDGEAGSCRKIRSISEGNFNGCYAANKAEKFKLRRLSQGIESCAHAQIHKIRKEEKEILRTLRFFEREKQKHDSHRRHRDLHFPLIPGQDSEGDLERLCSTESGNGFSTPATTSNLNKLKRASDSDARRLESDTKCFEAPNPRYSLPEITSSFKQQQLHQDCLPRTTSRSEGRRNSLQYGAATSRTSQADDVVPFYLSKTYAHYRCDPYYDRIISSRNSRRQPSLGDEKSDSSTWNKMAESQSQPTTLEAANSAELHSLQSKDKLQHPDASSTRDFGNNLTSSHASDSIKEIEEVEHVDSIARFESSASLLPWSGTARGSPSIISAARGSASMVGKLSKGSSRLLVDRSVSGIASRKFFDPLRASHNSFLTPSERHEIQSKFYPYRGRGGSTARLDREHPLLRIHKHVTQAPSKAILLKNMMLRLCPNKVSECDDYESFCDLLDAYDDGQYYPAYRPGTEYSDDDFRKLRKCKYLRLSRMNWDSLKSSVIESLLNGRAPCS